MGENAPILCPELKITEFVYKSFNLLPRDDLLPRNDIMIRKSIPQPSETTPIEVPTYFVGLHFE